jgi:hypothetical protein
MTTKYLIIKDAHINDFNKVDDIIETKVEAVIQLSGYESESEALYNKVLSTLIDHLIHRKVIVKSDHTDKLKIDPDYRVGEGYWDDPYLCALEYAERFGYEIEVLEVL